MSDEFRKLEQAVIRTTVAEYLALQDHERLWRMDGPTLAMLPRLAELRTAKEKAIEEYLAAERERPDDLDLLRHGRMSAWEEGD